MMHRKFLPLIFLCLALTSPALLSAGQPRIVGGHDANNGQWPWTVSLVTKDWFPYDGHFCGGTLIRANWVVTAAHCMHGETTKTVDVIANILDLTEDNGQRVAVKRIIKHPNYNAATDNNDLALLQLTEPVKNAVSLPLVKDNPRLTGMEATIVGWGLLNEHEDTYPGVLQEASLPIQSNEACKLSYGDYAITDKMLCAGYLEGGLDSCSGDSGGPLMIQQNGAWVLAGITSWGTGCARPELYGVYTRVSRFVDFINKTLATDYFALADVNHDKVVDDLDKTQKNKELYNVFLQWQQQCWQTRANCADVSKDKRITWYDFSLKKSQYQTAYRNWLNVYWLPEAG